MDELVELLRPFFPFHAAAMSSELHGTKLTSDRWHRIAAAAASLHSIPGSALGPEEHDRRNLGLAGYNVALKMAAILFNSRRPEMDADFVLWRIACLRQQILETLPQQQQQQRKDESENR
jgi:hypothetical protein